MTNMVVLILISLTLEPAIVVTQPQHLTEKVLV